MGADGFVGMEWNASNVRRANFSYMTEEGEWVMLSFDLSDLELPSIAQVILITIYTVTIIFAVTGNLLVIVVLLSVRRTRTEINVFLVNLAIADLCMACFCMPFSFTRTMLGRWIFGSVMCPLVLFMQVLSVTVSIYINVAIGIERFWGVVFPMRQKLTRSQARLFTAGIWLFACSVASAQLVVSRSNLQDYRGVRYWDCNERWSSHNGRHIYTVVITCVTYFVPLSLLAAVYSKIGSLLWLRKAPGNADDARDKLLLRSNQKVVKLVCTIVIVFAVCWFPLHTFNLVLDFMPQILDHIDSEREQYIFVAAYYACHWLAMANSFTNPIIFCFLNDNFKGKLRQWKGSLPSRSPSDYRIQPSYRISASHTGNLNMKTNQRYKQHKACNFTGVSMNATMV